METVQTQKLRTRVRARKFTNVLLFAGALGAVGYSAKELMKPAGRMEITGTAAVCRHMPLCEVPAKAGDVIWRANIVGGKSESSISVADVDGRGVAFRLHVRDASGGRSLPFRVNFDGSAENRPWDLGGIRVEPTPDLTVVKVKIE